MRRYSPAPFHSLGRHGFTEELGELLGVPQTHRQVDSDQHGYNHRDEILPNNCIHFLIRWDQRDALSPNSVQRVDPSQRDFCDHPQLVNDAHPQKAHLPSICFVRVYGILDCSGHHLLRGEWRMLRWQNWRKNDRDSKLATLVARRTWSWSKRALSPWLWLHSDRIAYSRESGESNLKIYEPEFVSYPAALPFPNGNRKQW